MLGSDRRFGIDPAHGYATLSMANGSVLRAAAGSVLYHTLIALLGLGALLAGGLLLRLRDA